MRRLVPAALLFFAFVRISAQPVGLPTPVRVAELRAMSALDPRVAADATPFTVNIASREEVRQFYNGVYNASANVPMGWTGNYTAASAIVAAGDTAAAFKEATRVRINFFRALAGVPAVITLSPTFDAMDQQAALMMSANRALQHTGIPTTWTYYTADGAQAAGASNLALGNAGPDAITAYISDNGTNNAAAGHRRWVFYPQTQQMGTGDVAGDGVNFQSANALWIEDAFVNSARPATRTTAVPYPPAGFVPYPLVWPRWSFTYPNADFSSATVTMTLNGTPIAVALETVNPTGGGETTLVWDYNGLDPALATTHPKPAVDTTYAVTVANVKIAGVAQSFTYNVTVFDPAVAGPDYTPVTVSGSASPVAGQANAYTAAKPPFAGSFDWRSLQLIAFTKTYDAENGLADLIATTSAGYSVVQSGTVGAGAASFRLAHVSPFSTQVLLLPETFYVNGTAAAITFLSRLGIATAIEVAHVQVSTDDGVSWSDVFTQAGTSPISTSPAPTEAAFVSHTVSLAAYSGRTVRVQLAFTADPGTAFVPTATNTVGWFIDNLTLTGVQSATAGAPINVASGTNFSFAPAVAGTVGLQARGVLFGAYPLEWGPLTQVTAIVAGAANDPGRLTNLSVLTDISATVPSFTAGITIGGAGTSGTKPLLVRAAGPSLGALGVPGTIPDPRLDVYSGQTVVSSNDNWGGDLVIAAAITQVGAFPYASGTSKDAAIFNAATAAGGYTLAVSGVGGSTGTVIAEVYDATPAGTFTATSPRLTNVSVLKQINANGSLTLGFTIGGSTPKTVLIRAIGPALGLPPFGIGGAMTDPQLTLFNSSSVAIKTNDNWGGDPQVVAAIAATGAFPVANTASKDAMLVATLAPGGYTATASGVGGLGGFTIVEVYEVP